MAEKIQSLQKGAGDCIETYDPAEDEDIIKSDDETGDLGDHNGQATHGLEERVSLVTAVKLLDAE